MKLNRVTWNDAKSIGSRAASVVIADKVFLGVILSKTIDVPEGIYGVHGKYFDIDIKGWVSAHPFYVVGGKG